MREIILSRDVMFDESDDMAKPTHEEGVIHMVCANDKGKVIVKDSSEGEDQHSSEGPTQEVKVV